MWRQQGKNEWRMAKWERTTTVRGASFAALGLCTLVACTPVRVVQTDVPRIVASHNEVPVSGNFPSHTQMKLQAAQHWASIANDTGKAIVTLLNRGSWCVREIKGCEAVFVSLPAPLTGFSRAFHSQLITTLVNNGLNVSKEEESAIRIEIDVLPILFSPNRPQYRYAGQATELGPGIWALRDAMVMVPEQPGQRPDEPDTLHWFRTELASGQTPQMEIVVTVSAVNKARYLARTTNVYYVTDGDRRLYDQEMCTSIRSCAAAQEEKKMGPTPRPSRAVGVTGDCPLDQPCCPEGKNCADTGGKKDKKT